MRAVLLDIEGTTTPISFVHDVLFPYARLNLRAYLEQYIESPQLISDLGLLAEEHAADISAGYEPPPLVDEYVYWLIDQDRKSTALKSLQGKIWEHGYNDGSLLAPVFADVRPALERWCLEGKTVNIFSSGSVLAQQLLFAHTYAGDLTKFINNYFDTNVGKKTDAESYRKIATVLALATSEIHFISDVTAELDAAAVAGMKTTLSIRPGNPTQHVNTHSAVRSFAEI